MLPRTLRRLGSVRPVRQSLVKPKSSLRRCSTKPSEGEEPKEVNKKKASPKFAPKWLRELVGIDDLDNNLYEQVDGLLPHRIRESFSLRVDRKKVGVVYGGAGALGGEVIKQIKSLNYEVVNIDIVKSEEAEHNVIVEGDPAKDSKTVLEWASKFPDLASKLVFVGCFAGGWAGGNLDAGEDPIATTHKMMNTSFYTSMIASQLAAQHMSFGGLLLFTGAAAALDPTPDMIGYGAAKAAVHHLSQSVAKAYYPRFDTVVICPGTLNTEANRTAMPDADQSTWTPLAPIAKRILFWCGRRELREVNGSLVKIQTERKHTVFMLAETRY